MLRICINEHLHQPQLGRIYVSYGPGDDDVFDLPWQSKKFVNRLFYIRKPVAHVRFDPCESETEFCLTSLNLIPVPLLLAKRHMFERVIKRHQAGFGQSPYECKVSISNQALKSNCSYVKMLSNLYNETFAPYSEDKSYAFWINYDEPVKRKVYEESLIPDNKIGFSIILPTYNTDPILLQKCIDSVCNQEYENWELCIADDASSNQATLDILKRYQDKFPKKIKLKLLSKNGHISKSSNAALSLATKPFVLLLDHDDLLPLHTLRYFSGAINQNRSAKFLYGDEDKIDEAGERHMPHFKPDWNRDLLLSQNYICHPAVISRELLNNVGGFREGVEGAQDHDLFLRITQTLHADQIVHIPFILYHWRVIAESTAANASAKSYTSEAGLKSVQDFLDNTKSGGIVQPGKFPNTYKIKWPVPADAPKISLIIPTRDGYDILNQCVTSIVSKTTYSNYEIIIVDNQTSCNKTLELFGELQSQYENIKVIKWDKPFNYSAINNYAVNVADGELIGLVNNDIEVINPDWLTEMVSHALRPEIGCVGAKLFYPNNTIQHAGVILGIGGVAGHSHKYFQATDPGYFTRLYLTQNLSAVTAACLVVRKAVYFEVNGLNEKDLTIAFNDVDFCLKVKSAGYRNLFTPWAELYHHESISRGEEDSPEKISRFNSESNYMKENWGELLKNDPAYNPNLSLTHENFSIK